MGLMLIGQSAEETLLFIEIFNVNHGFCALVTADDGQRVLLDCGRSSITGLSPSVVLARRGIRVLDALIVSHADEDHVSDLPNLLLSVLVRSVITNDSLGSDGLRLIKVVTGGSGPGVETLIWRKSPRWTALTGQTDFHPILPQAELVLFRNRFPSFCDLNNLSLVTFLHYGDIHAVFPGDLETAGWRSLLQSEDFQAHLSQVNVFVASHHGRENGFCEEVFDFCRPEVVIISDDAVQYESQEVAYRYANRATGVLFGQEKRRDLTTRCDGTISIYQSLSSNAGAWVVTDRSMRRFQRRPLLARGW